MLLKNTSYKITPHLNAIVMYSKCYRNNHVTQLMPTNLADFLSSQFWHWSWRL